jgi:iron complex transport system ATP-binding protein
VTAPRVQARGVSFRYGTRSVLDGVDLVLEPGEVVALLGANGAGKSTLLRILMGFEKPQTGSVTIGGVDVRSRSRQELARLLAYVPQAHHAPFPYTVREVVELGRIAHRGFLRPPDAADRRMTARTLERMELADFADRAYTALSGGERQRVLVARALAQEARVLVLDEPASSLDYGGQIRLLALLRRLARDGLSILFTTHHPEHVLCAADRAALLENGSIAVQDTPARVLTATTLRRLYGVEVELLARADGGTAFWPRLEPHVPAPEPASVAT